MLEIHVEPSQIRTVADRLASEPVVHLVGIMSGHYDIYAGAVFRSNQELVDFITRRLSKIPGIIRVSNTTVLEVVKRWVSFGFPDRVTDQKPWRKKKNVPRAAKRTRTA